jgi:hypothetical protein
LANTEWHLRFVRDRAPGRYDPERGPAMYAGLVPPEPPAGPLFQLPDSTIAIMQPIQVDRDVSLEAGGRTFGIPAGTVLYPRDQALILVLSRWLGRRPIAFGLSSAGATSL